MTPRAARPPEQDDRVAPSRKITLGPAVSLNIMNMIGVGPFITLPWSRPLWGPERGWDGCWVRRWQCAMGWCGQSWVRHCRALADRMQFLREIYKPSESRSADADAVRRFDAGRF